MAKQRLTNGQWMDHIADEITSKPKRLATQQASEQDFIKTFYNEVEGELQAKPNAELYGIVADEPHVSNLFMAVFYDRVVRESVRDGLRIVNKLDIFKKEDLVAGKTWSRLMADIMADESYDKDASPVTTNTANSHDIVKEAFSDVPLRRLIQFTIYEDGVQEAFRKEMGIQEMLDLFFKRVSDTLNFKVYNTLKRILRLSTTAGNVKAPFVDIVINATNDDYAIPADTPIDGAKLDEFGLTAIQSAQDFKYFLHSLVYDMSEPSRKYNVGDTDGQFLTSIPIGDAVCILDTNLLAGMAILQDANFMKDTEVSKLFSSIIPISNIGTILEVTRTLDGSGNPVLDADGNVTEAEVEDEDVKVLAVVADANIIEYRMLLERSLEWDNPRALYRNYFTHFWFATLVNNFLSGARILLDSSVA
jgi:hypothetical protein